jgi:hypothetical protein
MLFECLSYRSYIYTRKHQKRTVQSGGETSNGKIHLPLMTKGERFIKCRDRGMVPREADLSDTKDRGMVQGGE